MAITTEEGNPGAGYVRLALVHDVAVTETAMTRIAKVYHSQ